MRSAVHTAYRQSFKKVTRPFYPFQPPLPRDPDTRPNPSLSPHALAILTPLLTLENKNFQTNFFFFFQTKSFFSWK